jgi:alkanesulfonate monooxygenase SsuD/methylene tetrahydromethanopterin reductase-like flavin-dependent oxidoreductase (luciferase family)/FAD/FMN-containing dehydrogenase
MPDYGHDLRFGTFITPTNANPQVPVALAQLSEQLGYDLVTFQDHPYQPSFLDTQTLMTWVAASTSTIHVAANVLNVPLRPPAVLARAAASLDLLSGGRYELSLGAGGFWDAIEGMGGRKLTPGQAVDALEEAIDVIRALWAEERTGARLAGDYYQLNGAKRGPAPAHDMPIWVGALKPRMQKLIGRKADGWLPSLAYLGPTGLKDGNAIIDEAALESGRDPREIRRLVNVFGETDVDQLLPLVLEDGVGTIILASDDPDALRRFADEVAPALREAVDSERGPAGPPVRSAAALAARRERIDYDAIPSIVDAVEPGDFGYRGVRSTYMRGGSPGVVLRPADAAGVVEALAFARQQDVPLGVRSGGHGISGRSTNDGGVVIDLKKLNSVEVIGERLVRVGPGARWMDVAASLAEHGWALSSGDYGGVGVGGLATAGGIGWLARSRGLTIDHLRAAELVLADGSTVRASADENPELFWGLRGAGANFGIVTAFEFEVDAVGDIGFATLAFDATDTGAFLERWGATVEESPREVTSFLIMGGARPGQPPIAQVLVAVDSDDPEEIIALLQPFADIAPLVQQQVELKPYAAVMANASSAAHSATGEPTSRSALVEHLTPAIADGLAGMVASGASYFLSIRSVGGAVSDVPDDATAYAHRSANFAIAAIGASPERINTPWDALGFDALYLSFETDLRPERVTEAFPPETLARLRALKKSVDPENVFRDNFSVAP